MSKVTVSQPGALEDRDVAAAVGEYRTLVAQRYTPCPPAEIQRFLSVEPYLCSQKIDGELWFLDTTAGSPRLIAANGRVATGIKILSEAEALPKGLIISGELYVKKDGRERVGDVAKALAGSADELSFAAFDLVLSEGVSWQEQTYVERLEKLGQLIKPGSLHVIETKSFTAESEVIAFFNESVVNGDQEGIIVRCQDGRVLKVKKSITVDAAVLAFTTELSKDGTEQVRSVLFGLSLPDGDFVPIGATGNFDGAFSKVDLLKVLVPLEIESGYRQAAASGQLYRFVKPEVILETTVMDVQTEDSQGRRIRQTQLKLSNEGWEPAFKVPAASLLNAVVMRERNDKADVLAGVRWDQIADFAEVPSGSAVVLPAAEVVRRQVWTKSSADKTDVRKLVVFKTNKETIDPLYPAFVVHWTDFSSTRKAPLAREVKTAPNLETANEIAELLIVENVKKGWEPVS
jgi:hypothetical protein